MREKLTVAIYEDIYSENIEIEQAFEGVKLIQQITNAVKTEKQIRTVSPFAKNPNYINVDRVAWPDMSGDLNVVLTNRLIIENTDILDNGKVRKKALKNGNITVGYSLSNDRLGSLKVALINTLQMKRTDLVVAHEIGHLVGVAFEDENKLHCDTKSCIMATHIRDTMHIIDFCENCSNDFEINIQDFLFARKHKASNAIVPWKRNSRKFM